MIVDELGLKGSVIKGTWRVGDPVARGGFALVYCGVQIELGTPVAIKCLRLSSDIPEHQRTLMYRQLTLEARILRDLSAHCPSVAQLFDIGVINDVPYLVIEWLNGKTLKQALAERRARGDSPMSLRDILEYLNDAAAALRTAHRLNIVHSDVTPSNIFVLDNNIGPKMKVIDFGVARILAEHQPIPVISDDTNPQQVPFCGPYGAPEQFDPKLGACSRATDVHALALIVVELLSGQPPLGNGSLVERMMRVLDTKVRPSSRIVGKGHAPALERVLEKALAVRPADRYQDVDQFWERLTDIANQSQSRFHKGYDSLLPRGGSNPCKVVVAYATRDQSSRDQLQKYVVPQLGERISEWEDWVIDSASPKLSFDAHAPIILLFVSPELVKLGFCHGEAMSKILQRHEQGEVRILPVILRPVSWEDLPFDSLMPTTRFGTPLLSWENLRDAWGQVSASLRLVLKDLFPGSMPPPSISPSQGTKHMMPLVFRRSGPPGETFIETESFKKLKMSLLEPGRGIVVEGPSGTGKTTALTKALQVQMLGGSCPWLLHRENLTALVPEHVEKIKTLDRWHKEGTISIDDFHYLDQPTMHSVGRYMKLLADSGDEKRKLIILGIPGSGQSLNFGHDVSMRVDVIRFRKAEDLEIMHLVSCGERALNIQFERKADIVIAASGSLHLAQMICYFLCVVANIESTQARATTIRWALGKALDKAMEELGRKFKPLISDFGGLGGARDLTPLVMLKEIVDTEDGYLLLHPLMNRRPLLASRIARLTKEPEFKKFSNPSSDAGRQLFYDDKKDALIVEDPELCLCLSRMRLLQLAKIVGKASVLERPRILVCYSDPDEPVLRLIHSEIQNLPEDVDVYPVTVKPGPNWRVELEKEFEWIVGVIVLSSSHYLSVATHLDEFVKMLEAKQTQGYLIKGLMVNEHRIPQPFQRLSFVNTQPLDLMTPSEKQSLWDSLRVQIKHKIPTMMTGLPSAS